MAGTTENGGLTIWGKEDEFNGPAGLNGNFSVLDVVLAGKAEGAALALLQGAVAGKAEATAVAALQSQMAGKAGMVIGSYLGDGAETRTVELGFRPKAIFVTAGGNLYNSLLGLDGYDSSAIKVKDIGFFMQKYNNTILNGDGSRYYFLAFRLN